MEADGAAIETIEGEAGDDGLSDIQKAFDRNHAVQCGFCTPGMILSVRGTAESQSEARRRRDQGAIEGNFCRCTGYEQIVEAVLDVTGQRRRQGEAPPCLTRSDQDLTFVGSDGPRIDAAEKLTGEALYVSDMTCPACCTPP